MNVNKLYENNTKSKDILRNVHTNNFGKQFTFCSWKIVQETKKGQKENSQEKSKDHSFSHNSPCGRI